MIRLGMSETLAAQAATSGVAAQINSAALGLRAHYDKLAVLCPAVIGVWDFRHSLNRPTLIENGTLLPNLVRGGDPAIVDRAAGLALTSNAMRLTGAALASTCRIQLPVSVEPLAGQTQYGILLMANIVSSTGGTNRRGIFRWVGTTGMSLESTIAAPFLMSGRINNGTLSNVWPTETYASPVYPTVPDATQMTAVQGTPFDLGIAWAGRGYPLPLRSRNPSFFDGKYGGVGLDTVANDTTDMSGISTGGRMYLGENGIHSNAGFVLDVHRLVVFRWMASQGKPPQSEIEIAKLNRSLYGAGVTAGYTPA